MNKWLGFLLAFMVSGCVGEIIPPEPKSEHKVVALSPVQEVAPAKAVVLPSENMLLMPAVGAQQMRVLSPTLLELTLINSKASIQAPVTEWNFVTRTSSFSYPQAVICSSPLIISP